MKAIDVSHWQGNIKWAQVSDNTPSIDFAYIKATNGVGSTDPMFRLNAFGAAQAGLVFGSYHYATLNTPNVVQDARGEAEYFLSVVAKVPESKLPLVLDIEENKAGLTPNEVQGWIITFFETLKEKGKNNYALYSYTPFLSQNLPITHKLGDTKLWLAQYNSKPSPVLPHGWNSYWLWQYSAKGSVNGIVGNVDLNRSNSDIY